MNNITKIGTFEAISFMIVALINRIILNIPKEIIDKVGSSAWITVIIITVLTLGFILIICKLYIKFYGQNILDISEYLGGNFLKLFISFTFFITFLFINVIILRDFCNSIQMIFLESTPLLYIILFFLIASIIANLFGLNTIIKTNVIIIIFILFSVLIIFITPITNFELTNLFPIFGKGTKETFLYGLTNIFTFSGIGYLYFLMPLLKKPENFKKIAIISIIISGIYLLLSVLTLILIFSYLITSEDILSILLITRIIELTSFFQRIDAIFVLIWILTFMSYLSILLYFILYTFKHITNIKNQNGMILSFCTLICGLSLLPKNIAIINFLENEILKYIILIVTFILPFLIFLFANIKKHLKGDTNNYVKPY